MSVFLRNFVGAVVLSTTVFISSSASASILFENRAITSNLCLRFSALLGRLEHQGGRSSMITSRCLSNGSLQIGSGGLKLGQYSDFRVTLSHLDLKCEDLLFLSNMINNLRSDEGMIVSHSLCEPTKSARELNIRVLQLKEGFFR